MRAMTLCALAILASSSVAVAQTYSAGCPIAGRYSVDGHMNGAASDYTGEALITANGVGCYVKWFPPNTSEGAGTYANGIFTVNFQLQDERGVVQYARLPNGELRGTFWPESNPSFIQGTERLIPIQLATPSN